MTYNPSTSCYEKTLILEAEKNYEYKFKVSYNGGNKEWYSDKSLKRVGKNDNHFLEKWRTL